VAVTPSWLGVPRLAVINRTFSHATLDLAHFTITLSVVLAGCATELDLPPVIQLNPLGGLV
jgi:hypothetical protein